MGKLISWQTILEIGGITFVIKHKILLRVIKISPREKPEHIKTLNIRICFSLSVNKQ